MMKPRHDRSRSSANSNDSNGSGGEGSSGGGGSGVPVNRILKPTGSSSKAKVGGNGVDDCRRRDYKQEEYNSASTRRYQSPAKSSNSHRRNSRDDIKRDTKDARESHNIDRDWRDTKTSKNERNRTKDDRDRDYKRVGDTYREENKYRSSNHRDDRYKNSSNSRYEAYHKDHRYNSNNDDQYSSASNNNNNSSSNNNSRNGDSFSGRRQKPHQYHQQQHRRPYDERSSHRRYRRSSRSRSRSSSPPPQRNKYFSSSTTTSGSSYNVNRSRYTRTRHDSSPPPPPPISSQSRRSNTRSRTHSRSRSRSTDRQAKTRDRLQQAPLERARVSALEMERKLQIGDDVDASAQSTFHKTVVPSSTLSTSSSAVAGASATSTTFIAPLMSLPLSDTAPKRPNLIAATSGTNTNEEPAVIQLPSYYNPSIINPSKYAEQVQKRKLLWGSKKSEETAAKWGNAHFSQDSDGKVASKFMRLMGIKNSTASAANSSNADGNDKETAEQQQQVGAGDNVADGVPADVKSREKMFSSMEQQYEVARQVTHTMRGVGLGFSTQPRTF